MLTFDFCRLHMVCPQLEWLEVTKDFWMILYRGHGYLLTHMLFFCIALSAVHKFGRRLSLPGNLMYILSISRVT